MFQQTLMHSYFLCQPALNILINSWLSEIDNWHIDSVSRTASVGETVILNHWNIGPLEGVISWPSSLRDSTGPEGEC